MLQSLILTNFVLLLCFPIRLMTNFNKKLAKKSWVGIKEDLRQNYPLLQLLHNVSKSLGPFEAWMVRYRWNFGHWHVGNISLVYQRFSSNLYFLEKSVFWQNDPKFLRRYLEKETRYWQMVKSGHFVERPSFKWV